MRLIAAVCFLAITSNAASAVVSATQGQTVHPVLIRNNENPLIRIRIDAMKSVFLHAVTFSLEGTTDLSDIDSLAVFATGDSDRFSSAISFGDRQPPAKTVSIQGNLRLDKGDNFLWLSVRLKPQADLSHKVSIVCTEVATSAGRIRAQNESPGMTHRIGVALRRHFDDGVHTHRIAVIATTPKGTLLCAYDMRRRASRDLQEDIDIGLLRSTDGGQNWEAQRVIMDMGVYGGLPQEQNGCSDPGILVDRQTGEVFVAAVWTHGRPGTHQWSEGGSEPGFDIGKTAQFLMVRSQDDGKTWSKPENLTRMLKKKEWILFAPSPQQGIALADGTLIMPGQGRDEQDRHFSNLIISRDHGETWLPSNPGSFGNTECQAALLGDGSILLNCRSESPTKFRTLAVTRDLGKTWMPHPLNRKGLIEPNCNGSMIRFDYKQDGKDKHVLLFANPYSQERRENHSIRVSFDDGATWPEEHRILLDAGVGRGYPSLTQINETHLGVVYEGSRADLSFERLSLSELLRKR